MEKITAQIRDTITTSVEFKDATLEQIEEAIADRVQKTLNDQYGSIDEALK